MPGFDHTNPKSPCSFSHRQESQCILKKEPIQESGIEKEKRKEEGGQFSPVFDVQKNSELHSIESHFQFFSCSEFKYSERTFELCDTDRTAETFPGFSDSLFGYASMCLQVFAVN